MDDNATLSLTWRGWIMLMVYQVLCQALLKEASLTQNRPTRTLHSRIRLRAWLQMSLHYHRVLLGSTPFF
jgi:hypothetical protein